LLHPLNARNAPVPVQILWLLMKLNNVWTTTVGTAFRIIQPGCIHLDLGLNITDFKL